MQSMMFGLPQPVVIVLFSLVTVGAWGSWLVPLQLASWRDRSLELFHVALANLLVAGGVAWCQGGTARPGGAFFPAFLGGVVWAGSGLLALFAIRRLGSARAMGIWAPLNIAVSFCWGRLFFGEFREAGPGRLALIALAVAIMLGGIGLIVRQGREDADAAPASLRAWGPGVAAAVLVGILWGSYFLPIRFSRQALGVAALPMAWGIFAASLVNLAAARPALRRPGPGDVLKRLASGLLWSAGNYGSLVLIGAAGVGKGFALSQLCIVVNALWGVFLFRQPEFSSAAGKRVLAGCVLAALGGALLGAALLG